MTNLLRLATLLGAVPLVLGTSIYVAWRATGWPWLIVAGIWTLLLGFATVIVGEVVLVLHVRRVSRQPRLGKPYGRLRSILVAALLLANFPAAVFYALSAMEISTRYTVRVRNDGGVAFESFVVTGPGTSIEMGPIAPGEQVETHLHFRGDGTLRFSARQRERDFGGEIDGYVTTNVAGAKTVRIGRDGEFRVEDERRPAR